jgi:hypothetical protein
MISPPTGIVTRFDLYTNPEYRVWFSLKAYSAIDVVQVMSAIISVQKAMEENDKIDLVVSVLKNMFVACFLYRGWDVPNAFEAFDSTPTMAILMPETRGTQQSMARALSIASNAKHVNHAAIFLRSTDQAFPLTDEHVALLL